MIDLHSHILPGIDDGPADEADSVAMARIWADAGVHTVVATPHVDERYGVEAATIQAAVESLNHTLTEEGIALEVARGSEVDVVRLPTIPDDDLASFTLNGGNTLLLECPLTANASYLEEAVFGLQVKGFRVLLAHPERSPLFSRDLDRLGRLVDSGALCSITAGSMSGQFGSRVKETTIEMLAAGLVHNVASDAHDPVRRPPGFAQGFDGAESDLPGLAAQRDWFTRAVPAALIASEPIPAGAEPPARPRTSRSFLRRLRSRA